MINIIGTIIGVLLGMAGLFIGIWDLRVDLQDRDQDKGALFLKRKGDDKDGEEKK